MNNSTQSGFILVLALMVLSIGVLLVTQLFHRGSGHLYFDQAMIQREKATTLALSCLELAQSQLSLPATQALQQKQDRTQLLQQILPYLNRWQLYDLKEDVDGIDAQLRFMISCEHGKIDINQVFDFSKKDFKSQEIKNFIQLLFTNAKKFLKGKDLYSSFEKFLKDRKYPLDDPSDLLSVDEFKKVFSDRQFSFPTKQIDMRDTQQGPIYLFDIFTVCSNRDTVSIWALSDSLAGILGLRRAYAGTLQERTKLAQETIKNVDVDQKNLSIVWDSFLKEWYSKDYKALPKGMDQLFQATFNPIVFGIVCFAKVGSITQKLYAIIEREFDEKKGDAVFSLKKLYWI